MATRDPEQMLRSRPALRQAYAAQFLELFYPVHYRIGIGIEDAMRQGRLTRHEVAILWLMHTEGAEHGELRRKDVERRLTAWFEIQNSAVSKTLRALTRPPKQFVELFEDPTSGREKRVRLTSDGEAEIESIVTAGVTFIAKMVDSLTRADSEEGVRFLSKVSEIIETVVAKEPSAAE